MPCATYRVSIIGRGKEKSSALGAAAYGAGKVIRMVSVLAAASYLAGQPLRDEQLEQTFDYSSRDDVQHTQILTPEHAPGWAKDWEKLFNEIERKENRSNSQLVRSIIIALPRELTLEQNIALMRDHLDKEFVSKGMVASFAIHNIPAKDGGDQPHAHVLLTMRGFNADGTWQKNKNREWNGYDEHGIQRADVLNGWRDAWEKTQNEHLEKAGRGERVNMKSYAEQGVDKIPQIHLGPSAAEMEKNGISTDKGDYNRWVNQRNKLIEAVKGWAKRLFTREKPEMAREEVKRPEYTQEDIKAYYAKQEARAYRVDEPSIDEMKKWEQRREEERKAKEKAERGSEAKRDARQGAKPEAATRPRRVASPEDRDHYAAMRPFLQNYPWESRKDMLHFIAVTSKYMHKQKAEARRDPFERLDGTRDAFRYRAVYQDKPIPKQGRERSRGGRER